MPQCPFCLQSIGSDALSCSNCRARLSRLCPACAEEISSVAAQCGYCGATVSGPKAAEPPPYAMPDAPPPYAMVDPPPAAPADGIPLATVDAPAPGFMPPMVPPAPPERVPWEDTSMGLFARFWDTCKGPLASPGNFFEAVPKRGGLGAPVLFALLVSFGASLIAVLTCNAPALLLEDTIVESQKDSRVDPEEMRKSLHANLIQGFAEHAVQPVMTLVWLFVGGGLVHALAKAFGAKGTYETTVRALAYAHGPILFAWIPFLGGCLWYVAAIWALVLTCIGVGKMHGIGGGKGTGATILPALAMACLFIGPFVVVGFMRGIRKAQEHRRIERREPPPREEEATPPPSNPDDEPMHFNEPPPRSP